MNKITLILICLIMCGCSTTPTWTKASPEQRANLNFTEDANYLESTQYTNDINDSVETVLRLRGEK